MYFFTTTALILVRAQWVVLQQLPWTSHMWFPARVTSWATCSTWTWVHLSMSPRYRQCKWVQWIFWEEVWTAWWAGCQTHTYLQYTLHTLCWHSIQQTLQTQYTVFLLLGLHNNAFPWSRQCYDFLSMKENGDVKMVWNKLHCLPTGPLCHSSQSWLWKKTVLVDSYKRKCMKVVF